MKLAALVLVACGASRAPAPVSNHARPSPPHTLVEPNTVTGRIIRFEQVGTDQILTINRGMDHGVQKSWRAKLVLDNGASLVEVIVIRIDETTSILKVTGAMRVDVPRTTVQFRPPEPEPEP